MTIRDRRDGDSEARSTERLRSQEGPIERRVTAERDGELVVFHIGMRINSLWKFHLWLPILLFGPRMVRELRADPDSGLLGSRTVVGPGIRHVEFVQYWESFDALEAYARDGDRSHVDGWRTYLKRRENSAVGIWHETYRVAAGEYETVYDNMPPHGLAASEGTAIVPATGRRESAAGRIGTESGADETDGENGAD
ncbi:DUF4188 domain-containing protein [Natrinema sp. 74]|uniref:DUF4188 domain-containing protein n=1 Tax=Natrinema sp. 74 TaxID=3384159 RepID=UPI0038D436A6